MKVIGINAKLLRDQAGNNLYYNTNSITLAGGESIDVILDASDTTEYPAGRRYYLYTPNLDHLSNDAENFGGLMTEVHICNVTERSHAIGEQMNMTKKRISKTRLLLAPDGGGGLLLTATAYAAAPGITRPDFQPDRATAYITQPDGARSTPGDTAATAPPAGFAPAGNHRRDSAPRCRFPGPTLIVTRADGHGEPHKQPPLRPATRRFCFPAFNVTATGGVAGLLTQEAATRRHSDLHVHGLAHLGHAPITAERKATCRSRWDLYGAIIVLPIHDPQLPARRDCTLRTCRREAHSGETDFRLAAAAYNHPQACYDREYLFQFSEMDPKIHRQAEEQVRQRQLHAGAADAVCKVATEPYHPAYFMINGRSMPDDMDPNYASQYPHQPYNGNPHMHPGEQVLLRVIGQGRWQHPFHEHGNHVRILARDGNLILSADRRRTASPARCSSPPPPLRAWRWTESSTGPARV